MRSVFRSSRRNALQCVTGLMMRARRCTISEKHRDVPLVQFNEEVSTPYNSQASYMGRRSYMVPGGFKLFQTPGICVFKRARGSPSLTKRTLCNLKKELKSCLDAPGARLQATHPLPGNADHH
jgi:hypothetical protein